MFSYIADALGRVIGETAHQLDKAVDDIIAIPEAFSKGYDEELFDAPTTPDAKSETPKDI